MPFALGDDAESAFSNPAFGVQVWLTDKTLDLPWEQAIGRGLTLIIADFLVLPAHNLRKSA